MNLKILTFNWHAPYLFLLTKMGYKWLIVEPEVASGIIKHWEWEMRPIPENALVISESKAIQKMEDGEIDLIVAHNIKDLIFVREFQIPKIMVFHNRLTTEIGLSRDKIERNDYLNKINDIRKGVKEIFISKSKKFDWGGSGEVITPGIDSNDYKGYTGESSTIMRIGNHFKERDLMLGYSVSQKIIDGFPCLTLGINPKIPGTQLAENFNELRKYYQKNRVYINTTMEGFEDGYNLSMLEAMATGMPIVSIYNSTSPLNNGINGFISNDINYLRQCVEKLIKDPELAINIGAKGRKTVINNFGIKIFIETWKRIIKETIIEYLKKNRLSLNTSNNKYDSKNKIGIASIAGGREQLIFEQIDDDMLDIIPNDAFYIMDFGCSSEKLAERIKKRQNAFLIGVDIKRKIGQEDKVFFDEIVECDVEGIQKIYEYSYFDCIVANDTLGQVSDPLKTLGILKNLLKPRGLLVVRFSNAQGFNLVSNLMEGSKGYTAEDKVFSKDLKFFTENEIDELFGKAGYQVVSCKSTLEEQFKESQSLDEEILKTREMDTSKLNIDSVKKNFVNHYIIIASPLPILKDSYFEKSDIEQSNLNLSLKKAKQFESLSDISGAINIYNDLLKIYPNSTDVLLGLGNCSIKSGKKDNAQSYFMKALEIEPNNIFGILGLALLDLQTGHSHLAIDRFYKILRIKPNYDRALCGMGLAYEALGNKVMALEFLVKSLNSNIENRSAMASLLKLSYDLDRFDEVDMMLRKYLERHPANLNILFGLAGVNYKMGLMKEAQEHLNQIFIFKPDHKDACELMGRIDEKQISSTI